jgi:hypothetical protein
MPSALGPAARAVSSAIAAVQANAAALANGALTHAFELDRLSGRIPAPQYCRVLSR